MEEKLSTRKTNSTREMKKFCMTVYAQSECCLSVDEWDAQKFCRPSPKPPLSNCNGEGIPFASPPCARISRAGPCQVNLVIV